VVGIVVIAGEGVGGACFDGGVGWLGWEEGDGGGCE